MGFRLPGRGRNGAEPPRFAVNAEVRAYWEGLRQPGQLPRREMIDPRGIAGALDCVFMAERIGPGLARFRLAGSRINALAGADVKGAPLSLIVQPEARLRLARALERVFNGPAMAEAVITTDGPNPAEGRLLLLPLVSTRGVTDLCLGCLSLDAMPSRPRRLSIIRAVETLLGPDTIAPAILLREVADPAASPPQPPATGARPALRLIPRD